MPSQEGKACSCNERNYGLMEVQLNHGDNMLDMSTWKFSNQTSETSHDDRRRCAHARDLQYCSDAKQDRVVFS
jgi:hypothetical protein